jgi:hypothetical protein
MGKKLGRLLTLIGVREPAPVWRDWATGREKCVVEPCGHVGCPRSPRQGPCVWL